MAQEHESNAQSRILIKSSIGTKREDHEGQELYQLLESCTEYRREIFVIPQRHSL